MVQPLTLAGFEGPATFDLGLEGPVDFFPLLQTYQGCLFSLRRGSGGIGFRSLAGSLALGGGEGVDLAPRLPHGHLTPKHFLPCEVGGIGPGPMPPKGFPDWGSGPRPGGKPPDPGGGLCLSG